MKKYMRARTTLHTNTFIVARRVLVNMKLLVFVKTNSHKAHFSLLTTLQLPITTILLESSTFSFSEISFVAIFLLLRGYISFGDLWEFIHGRSNKAVLLCKLPFVFPLKVFISAFYSMDYKKKIQIKTALLWGLFTAMKCQ